MNVGTEQEWKLAQSSMEAASNGLYAVANELCNASLKAKSASGYSPLFFRTNCFPFPYLHM
jgi:hypothetical protein